MEKSFISLLKLPDLAFAHIYLKLFHEKNALIIFTFHTLFKNEEEITLNHVNPHLGTTLDHFRQFVEYYLNHDYSFISHNDILNGLDCNQNYIMATFDDGYFNNIHVLPILKKFKIPAIFFVSTGHIMNNKCFWWDVSYRQRVKLGTSFRKIRREEYQLKTKTNRDIEKHLIAMFGKDVFHPLSDIDRPFTPLELKDFCKEKYVFIGNHTSDHAILRNCSPHEIKSQMLGAQDFIYDLTGIYPSIISYPDGYYSDEVIRISKEIGFQLGVTTDFKKNYLPIDCQKDKCMRLGRFDLGGCTEPLKLCELFRSNVVFYKWIENFFNKRYQKR